MLAAWVAARQRVGDLEARVVRDTNELFARSHPRPVHVGAASPGATGDAVARHLPPFEAAAQALAKDEAALQRTREVVSGTAPLVALPAVSAAALERLEPDLDALLRATRAERADFPATRDHFSLLEGSGGWVGWQLAATFAGVRMRLALAAGQPRRAVVDGLDGIALGRDAAIAWGLVGRMVGAAIVSRLAPPMTAAIDALPDAAARRDVLERVRALRDAIPPFSRTLADESTLTQLYVGDALPASLRAALDPRARTVMQDGLRETGWWQRLAIRDGWRELREAQDALIAAADLPEPDRSAAFAAVNARVTRSVNPFAAIGLPSYLGYARRADAATRRLDALVLAAAAGALHAERGRWPASLAEVAAAGEIDPSEAARLADVALEEMDGGRALSIRVPLPRADGEEPSDLAFVLRGGRTRRD